jgi:hypothetical protein
MVHIIHIVWSDISGIGTLVGQIQNAMLEIKGKLSMFGFRRGVHADRYALSQRK